MEKDVKGRDGPALRDERNERDGRDEHTAVELKINQTKLYISNKALGLVLKFAAFVFVLVLAMGDAGLAKVLALLRLLRHSIETFG